MAYLKTCDITLTHNAKKNLSSWPVLKRTEHICMACHNILPYGVISDIEEYFLLFFFLLSNTTSSWFCIKFLKFKINHNHKFTSSASRSNSRSCRQRSSFIFLLAHSSSSWVRLSFNCLSTPTGKQNLLSTTLNDFFHVFFSQYYCLYKLEVQITYTPCLLVFLTEV